MEIRDGQGQESFLWNFEYDEDDDDDDDNNQLMIALDDDEDLSSNSQAEDGTKSKGNFLESSQVYNTNQNNSSGGLHMENSVNASINSYSKKGEISEKSRDSCRFQPSILSKGSVDAKRKRNYPSKSVENFSDVPNFLMKSPEAIQQLRSSLPDYSQNIETMGVAERSKDFHKGTSSSSEIQDLFQWPVDTGHYSDVLHSIGAPVTKTLALDLTTNRNSSNSSTSYTQMNGSVNSNADLTKEIQRFNASSPDIIQRLKQSLVSTQSKTAASSSLRNYDTSQSKSQSNYAHKSNNNFVSEASNSNWSQNDLSTSHSFSSANNISHGKVSHTFSHHQLPNPTVLSQTMNSNRGISTSATSHSHQLVGHNFTTANEIPQLSKSLNVNPACSGIDSLQVVKSHNGKNKSQNHQNDRVSFDLSTPSEELINAKSVSFPIVRQHESYFVLVPASFATGLEFSKPGCKSLPLLKILIPSIDTTEGRKLVFTQDFVKKFKPDIKSVLKWASKVDMSTPGTAHLLLPAYKVQSGVSNSSRDKTMLLTPASGITQKSSSVTDNALLSSAANGKTEYVAEVLEKLILSHINTTKTNTTSSSSDKVSQPRLKMTVAGSSKVYISNIPSENDRGEQTTSLSASQKVVEKNGHIPIKVHSQSIPQALPPPPPLVRNPHAPISPSAGSSHLPDQQIIIRRCSTENVNQKIQRKVVPIPISDTSVLRQEESNYNHIQSLALPTFCVTSELSHTKSVNLPSAVTQQHQTRDKSMFSAGRKKKANRKSPLLSHPYQSLEPVSFTGDFHKSDHVNSPLPSVVKINLSSTSNASCTTTTPLSGSGQKKRNTAITSTTPSSFSNIPQARICQQKIVVSNNLSQSATSDSSLKAITLYNSAPPVSTTKKLIPPSSAAGIHQQKVVAPNHPSQSTNSYSHPKASPLFTSGSTINRTNEIIPPYSAVVSVSQTNAPLLKAAIASAQSYSNSKTSALSTSVCDKIIPPSHAVVSLSSIATESVSRPNSVIKNNSKSLPVTTSITQPSYKSCTSVSSCLSSPIVTSTYALSSSSMTPEMPSFVAAPSMPSKSSGSSAVSADGLKLKIRLNDHVKSDVSKVHNVEDSKSSRTEETRAVVDNSRTETTEEMFQRFQEQAMQQVYNAQFGIGDISRSLRPTRCNIAFVDKSYNDFKPEKCKNVGGDKNRNDKTLKKPVDSNCTTVHKEKNNSLPLDSTSPNHKDNNKNKNASGKKRNLSDCSKNEDKLDINSFPRLREDNSILVKETLSTPNIMAGHKVFVKFNIFSNPNSSRSFLAPFFNLGGSREQFDSEDMDYIKKAVIDIEKEEKFCARHLIYFGKEVKKASFLRKENRAQTLELDEKTYNQCSYILKGFKRETVKKIEPEPEQWKVDKKVSIEIDTADVDSNVVIDFEDSLADAVVATVNEPDTPHDAQHTNKWLSEPYENKVLPQSTCGLAQASDISAAPHYPLQECTTDHCKSTKIELNDTDTNLSTNEQNETISEIEISSQSAYANTSSYNHGIETNEKNVSKPNHENHESVPKILKEPLLKNISNAPPASPQGSCNYTDQLKELFSSGSLQNTLPDDFQSTSNHANVPSPTLNSSNDLSEKTWSQFDATFSVKQEIIDDSYEKSVASTSFNNQKSNSVQPECSSSNHVQIKPEPLDDYFDSLISDNSKSMPASVTTHNNSSRNEMSDASNIVSVNGSVAGRQSNELDKIANSLDLQHVYKQTKITKLDSTLPDTTMNVSKECCDIEKTKTVDSDGPLPDAKPVSESIDPLHENDDGISTETAESGFPSSPSISESSDIESSSCVDSSDLSEVDEEQDTCYSSNTILSGSNELVQSNLAPKAGNDKINSLVESLKQRLIEPNLPPIFPPVAQLETKLKKKQLTKRRPSQHKGESSTSPQPLSTSSSSLSLSSDVLTSNSTCSLSAGENKSLTSMDNEQLPNSSILEESNSSLLSDMRKRFSYILGELNDQSSKGKESESLKVIQTITDCVPEQQKTDTSMEISEDNSLSVKCKQKCFTQGEDLNISSDEDYEIDVGDEIVPVEKESPSNSIPKWYVAADMIPFNQNNKNQVNNCENVQDGKSSGAKTFQLPLRPRTKPTKKKQPPKLEQPKTAAGSLCEKFDISVEPIVPRLKGKIVTPLDSTFPVLIGRLNEPSESASIDRRDSFFTPLDSSFKPSINSIFGVSDIPVQLNEKIMNKTNPTGTTGVVVTEKISTKIQVAKKRTKPTATCINARENSCTKVQVAKKRTAKKPNSLVIRIKKDRILETKSPTNHTINTVEEKEIIPQVQIITDQKATATGDVTSGHVVTKATTQKPSIPVVKLKKECIFEKRTITKSTNNFDNNTVQTSDKQKLAVASNDASVKCQSTDDHNEQISSGEVSTGEFVKKAPQKPPTLVVKLKKEQIFEKRITSKSKNKLESFVQTSEKQIKQKLAVASNDENIKDQITPTKLNQKFRRAPPIRKIACRNKFNSNGKKLGSLLVEMNRYSSLRKFAWRKYATDDPFLSTSPDKLLKNVETPKETGEMTTKHANVKPCQLMLYKLEDMKWESNEIPVKTESGTYILTRPVAIDTPKPASDIKKRKKKSVMHKQKKGKPVRPKKDIVDYYQAAIESLRKKKLLLEEMNEKEKDKQIVIKTEPADDVVEKISVQDTDSIKNETDPFDLDIIKDEQYAAKSTGNEDQDSISFTSLAPINNTEPLLSSYFNKEKLKNDSDQQKETVSSFHPDHSVRMLDKNEEGELINHFLTSFQDNVGIEDMDDWQEDMCDKEDDHIDDGHEILADESLLKLKDKDNNKINEKSISIPCNKIEKDDIRHNEMVDCVLPKTTLSSNGAINLKPENNDRASKKLVSSVDHKISDGICQESNYSAILLTEASERKTISDKLDETLTRVEPDNPTKNQNTGQLSPVLAASKLPLDSKTQDLSESQNVMAQRTCEAIERSLSNKDIILGFEEDLGAENVLSKLVPEKDDMFLLDDGEDELNDIGAIPEDEIEKLLGLDSETSDDFGKENEVAKRESTDKLSWKILPESVSDNAQCTSSANQHSVDDPLTELTDQSTQHLCNSEDVSKDVNDTSSCKLSSPEIVTKVAPEKSNDISPSWKRILGAQALKDIEKSVQKSIGTGTSKSKPKNDGKSSEELKINIKTDQMKLKLSGALSKALKLSAEMRKTLKESSAQSSGKSNEDIEINSNVTASEIVASGHHTSVGDIRKTKTEDKEISEFPISASLNNQYGCEPRPESVPSKKAKTNYNVHITSGCEQTISDVQPNVTKLKKIDIAQHDKASPAASTSRTSSVKTSTSDSNKNHNSNINLKKSEVVCPAQAPQENSFKPKKPTFDLNKLKMKLTPILNSSINKMKDSSVSNVLAGADPGKPSKHTTNTHSDFINRVNDNSVSKHSVDEDHGKVSKKGNNANANNNSMNNMKDDSVLNTLAAEDKGKFPKNRTDTNLINRVKDGSVLKHSVVEYHGKLSEKGNNANHNSMHRVKDDSVSNTLAAEDQGKLLKNEIGCSNKQPVQDKSHSPTQINSKVTPKLNTAKLTNILKNLKKPLQLKIPTRPKTSQDLSSSSSITNQMTTGHDSTSHKRSNVQNLEETVENEAKRLKLSEIEQDEEKKEGRSCFDCLSVDTQDAWSGSN